MLRQGNHGGKSVTLLPCLYCQEAERCECCAHMPMSNYLSEGPQRHKRNMLGTAYEMKDMF